jgi:iron complex transport system substrate-binding protein
MRIVSLLPSTTEIISALGLEEHLVGRSHECSQSTFIKSLPAITSPEMKTSSGSEDIHADVQSLIENGLSVYKIDGAQLESLNPDLILTQDHCEVCAASLQDVEQAVRAHCSPETRVLSVSPESLDEVFGSIQAIGEAADVKNRAQQLVDELKLRMDIIRQTINGTPRKKVVTIEWMEPLMTGGNWIPELVELAGGEALLAEPGKHSPVIEWELITEANPDQLLIMPCGYTINQTLDEMNLLSIREGWREMKASSEGEIYILDGDRFFNRPGPGLFDSARILAEIMHPKLFKPIYQHDGWTHWKNSS